MDTSDLIKIWRVEKRASQLEKLPQDFYGNSKKLITDLGSNPYEKEKAEELFNEIVAVRQHKMLMAVLRQLQGEENPTSMAGAEEAAYNKILEELKALRSAENKEEVIKLEELEEPPEEEPEEPEKPEGQTELEMPKKEPEKAEEPEKPKREVFKEKTENKGNLRRVRFLKPMPAFVGPNLQTIGPFKEDDVVEIPDDVAEILMKNDAVEET